MQCSIFFNDTATTEIYTLSLHDALPISPSAADHDHASPGTGPSAPHALHRPARPAPGRPALGDRTRVGRDRKSTRLNSSHANISYAVFCLKNKETATHRDVTPDHGSSRL